MNEERGRVIIPHDFFNRTAKKEYSYWFKALIREFLQNSVDAGAKNIRFDFDKDNNTLLVTDDGCGMTRDIIVFNLLALGGTAKPENSIGGFGKAKEILFFAWKRYVIKTNDRIIEGAGPDYVIKMGDHTDGTQCLIEFYTPHELTIVYRAAEEYLPRNEINANIWLDNNKVERCWKNKKKIRDFEWANIYICDKHRTFSDVSIRANGVEMYARPVYTHLENQVVVELKGKSYELLTANRDCLNFKYNKDLNMLIDNLSINPISALKNFEKENMEAIYGKHVLSIPYEILTKINNKSDININDIISLSKNSIPSSKFKFNNIQYHFIIRKSNDVSNQIVDQFMSDPIAESLARIWTSMIFEIILANKIIISSIEPGFLFSNTTKGFCILNNNKAIILFNPLSENILKSKNISLLISAMEDIAYHEVAHIINSRHDERFVISSEDIRMCHRLWKSCFFDPDTDLLCHFKEESNES